MTTTTVMTTKRKQAGATGLSLTTPRDSKRNRAEIIVLLNRRLADGIDLALRAKQAHWNVRGRDFVSLHRLFDEIHASVVKSVYLLAERVVQLGGVADGSVDAVRGRTALTCDNPVGSLNADQYLDALSDDLSTFGRAIRETLEEVADFEDAVTTDILTDILRGIDRWFWMIDAQLNSTQAFAKRLSRR